MTDLNKKLESPDWEVVRTALDGAEGNSAELLNGVFRAEWGTGLEIQIEASITEYNIESCTFTYEDQRWLGGWMHQIPTTFTFAFKEDDVESLCWAVACLMADHWNQRCKIPYEEDLGSDPNSSEYFHYEDGEIHEDEPYPVMDDDDDCEPEVEVEYLDGYDSLFTGDFDPSKISITVGEQEVPSELNRKVLLALALTAGVDFDKATKLAEEDLTDTAFFTDLEAMQVACCT
jgi:hypothetical protein